LAIALSTLLAISVTLSADPGGLTLGKDSSARIQIRVTGLFGRAVPGARVLLSTNVGALGEPQQAGDGAFTAAFTPPRSRAPAVALIAAEAEADGDRALGWLALPLAGSDSMTLETKPHASVHLRIADRDFGPAVANAKGEVQLQVVVPPGVDKATMHVQDALGNTADRQLDLDPPPFARMRVLPVGPAQAAAGESLELQAFLVRRDGSPDAEARVTASAGRGGVDVSRNRRGIVAVSWQAPLGAAGQTAIEVQGLGERAEVRASIAPGAGRPRGGWLAGFGAPSAGLLGSVGTTFSGVPAFGATVELAIPVMGTPFEALLDVGRLGWPPSWERGRRTRSAVSTCMPRFFSACNRPGYPPGRPVPRRCRARRRRWDSAPAPRSALRGRWDPAASCSRRTRTWRPRWEGWKIHSAASRSRPDIC